MSPVRTFLVEAYAPAQAEFTSLLEQARLAAAASEAGAAIRHLRSILVRDDETCFHLFEAESVAAVTAAMAAAEVRAQRIVEVAA